MTSPDGATPQPNRPPVQRAAAPGATDPAPSGPTPTRRRRDTRRRKGPVRRVLTWVGITALLLVVAVLGYATFEYFNLSNNLQRSDVLAKIHPDEPNQPGLASDTNILIMGLDSRLDLQGNPLPQELYDAMHTGDSSIGGMNANVLMMLHIPADGRQATVLQIPRDDFVDYAGCYRNPEAGTSCDGKIKEAYDHAFREREADLANTPGLSAQEKHRQARDAGRAAQILTVEKFLGNGIRFDHWVEVTMVAFYQIAQEVQPITVCLKQDTKDSFSGADFKAGKQQISAEQAVAFVRQRRDALGDESFSDLDRERRQQAFIASLIFQLKQRGTLANPARLNGLVQVATRNVAVDNGLQILEFAGQARQLSDGKVTFYTLPIEDYIQGDKYGGWSNRVDVAKIQATVKSLLDPGREQTAAPTSPATGPGATSTSAKPAVTVVNASGVEGAATRALTALVEAGYPRGGEPTTGPLEAVTMVEYPAGQADAASELSLLLGPSVATVESATLPANQLRVTLGSGFVLPAALDGTPTSAATPGGVPSNPATPGAPTTAPTPLTPTTVGTGGANEDTAPSALTAMAGGAIPCVK